VTQPAIEDTSAWSDLEVYRQRYDIEDRLQQVRSLERSIARRRARETTLRRQVETLTQQIEEIRRQVSSIESEILGSLRAGNLLIEDILDRVRRDQGEAWAPTPIHGYRMWWIENNVFHGSQMPWTTPTMSSSCLREVPGEDIPHSESRCGPPACGVYAVKDFDMFPARVSDHTEEGSAVGVVAMTGKVIEHAHGYRAARASVLAIWVRHGGNWLATADPEQIRALFDDPQVTVRSHGKTGFTPPSAVRAFLESSSEKEETWISGRS
jgi:hypothetical protein